MEFRSFVIKIEVQKQKVSIKDISIKLIIVDPLTKGLPPKKFIKCVTNMSIIVKNKH